MNSIPQDDTPQKRCTGPCQRMLPATTDFFHKNRNKLHALCKECRNISLKAYNDAHVEDRKKRYQEHREEVRMKQGYYRETHREKVNEQKRQHYKTHREEIRVKQGYYFEAHRKEINEQKKRSWKEDHGGQRTKQLQHYQEHREEKLASAAHYRNTHCEEISKRQRQSHQRQRALYLAQRRIYKQRRRARLRSLEGTLTVQQIQVKMKAQHYACYYCFRTFKQRKDKTYIYHLDHTIPVSRPEFTPRNDASYVVLACPRCNQRKNNKLSHECAEGGTLF